MGALDVAPKTWNYGEVVTAGSMNAEIRDKFTVIQAAWTNYTPTITATTNPVVGSTGSVKGRYMQIGKTVWVVGNFLFGGTGAAYGSGAWNISLPVPANGVLGASTFFHGSCVVNPTGGSTWIPGWCPGTTTAFNLYIPQSTTWSNTGPLGSGSTPGGVTMSGATQARWNLTYEAA